jgi:hypothetical protein
VDLVYRNDVAIAVFCALVHVAEGRAQSVSGQISGTVVDSYGASVAGASVRLTAELTKQSRALSAGTDGTFLFTNLVPADYAIHITNPGFRGYDQRSIHVSASEHVALHDLKLSVGDVSTTVEVIADAARVDTDSADRSVTITSAEIEATPMSGRDYLSILRSLPGVQVTATSDRPGWGSAAPGVNGGQGGQFLVTLDGIASQDSGDPRTGGYLAPNVDAIGEVKVLVSNYSAEYGARAGGQMNVQIKNGTNQFHGSTYYFWRHEQFSANEWFNNRTGLPRPRYRYANPGGTVGGPVFLPGLGFNKSRTKLFFFFSEDYLHTSVTGGVVNYTMPTANERAGDFSRTVTSTGVLIPVKDPSTGVVLPGNVLPQSRVSPIGFAMMNLFPTPSATDPTGRRSYNGQYQFTRDQPREDRILRLDYNLGKQTTSYARLIQDFQGDRGVGSTLNGGGGWGQFASNYDIQSAGFSATVIRTIRANLINETTVGINRAHQSVSPTDPAAFQQINDISALKGPDGKPVTVPHFFAGNYLNLIPNISLGTNGAQSAGQAVTAPPGFSRDSRWPFNGTDQLLNVTSNLTWIKGKHNVRVGFYFEHDSRNVSAYSTYNTAGSFWFGSDISNPSDTGYAYSNLLAGTVQAYGEDNIRLVNHARYSQVEWFAQDSWKVQKRLSLDLGVRFQVLQPTYSVGGTLGLFAGSAYDNGKSGQLLFPALRGTQKIAVNPVTGAAYPFARATSFDPASYTANALPYSGLVQYKDAFFHTPPVQYGPRVGFAWDVFGNGRTAVRGGFGIFYGRAYGVDTIGATSSGTGPLAAPPAFRSPIYYNSTFTDLLNTQGFYGAQNVNGGSQDYKNPTTYNWSFGVQQDLRHGIILDASYVANVAHHGFGTANDANAVPPLTVWTPAGGSNPKYLDPTSAGGGTGAFYATSLIRAKTGYEGYGSISTYTSLGESSYNSLQVSVKKRFNKRYLASGNYTWSKTITFAHQQWIPDQLTKNVVNRPHAVNLQFGVELPRGSRIWPNFLTKGALDGWHFNGVGALFSGSPLTVGCTVTNAPIGYWTGTPTGGIPFRCQMSGNLWLPEGTANPGNIEPRLWYPFDKSSFALPGVNSLGFGNTPPTLTYGPGFQNWDLSVDKAFRIGEGQGKNAKSLELRAEAFNALNHFNPSNPNAGLTYNYTTGAQTNASFGAIGAAQHVARRLSVSLKVRF